MRLIWQLIDSGTIGGIERHIEMLSRGLSRSGFRNEVVLYADHSPNPWLTQLKQANISFRILGGSITSLMAAMQRDKPALIHTHGYKAGIIGRVTALLSRIPVTSTFHSGEHGPFPVSIYQTIDEMSAFLAPAIAVSQPIKDRLNGHAKVIHNFIETPQNPPTPGRKPTRIGFVGRFSYEKGPDQFCLLANSMINTPANGEIEWHAFGDGPMLAELQIPANRNIHFHGLQSDMSTIWPTLDLLVMPSRAEGLPFAALEALTHGIPVIATKLGALPEVIRQGETGWLFNGNDLEQAASFISQWLRLDSKGRVAMFDTCRSHVEQNFSAQKQIAAILRIYNQSGLRTAA